MVWILIGNTDSSVGFFEYVRQEVPITAQKRKGESL
jgi:hypothetical protein